MSQIMTTQQFIRDLIHYGPEINTIMYLIDEDVWIFHTEECTHVYRLTD